MEIKQPTFELGTKVWFIALATARRQQCVVCNGAGSNLCPNCHSCKEHTVYARKRCENCNATGQVTGVTARVRSGHVIGINMIIRGKFPNIIETYSLDTPSLPHSGNYEPWFLFPTKAEADLVCAALLEQVVANPKFRTVEAWDFIRKLRNAE